MSSTKVVQEVTQLEVILKYYVIIKLLIRFLVLTTKYVVESEEIPNEYVTYYIHVHRLKKINKGYEKFMISTGKYF